MTFRPPGREVRGFPWRPRRQRDAGAAGDSRAMQFAIAARGGG